MAEIIRVQDDYYILATSALADSRTRVLKDGDTFALFDRSGDIRTLGRGELGVYHRGTRYLSRLELRIGEGVRPLLLHSSVKSDNEILTVDLTNPDEVHEGVVRIERDTFHLLRSSFLNGSVFHSRIRVRSFDAAPGPYVVRLRFAADFVDIFEVRGMKRPQRGELLEPVLDDDGVLLSYRGLDGIALRSRIDFHPRPTEIRADEAVFRFQIAPGREEMIYLAVSCLEGEDMEASRTNLPNAFLAKSGPRRAPRPGCRITTSHEQFDEWIDRSVADLDMLTTDLPTGPYPDAGVPWFSTRFGRDGIITALQCLWFYPELARGVLGYLAQTQAREIVAEKDAEPGKILHEARDSEMARLGEIPFGQYYGTVDATPLFVMLAGAYYRRTGDGSFAEYIWPHVDAALEWIDRYGDLNGDGFIEYEKKTPNGLDQQGWKDSHDSVYHADGTPAKPPIALCEVQGYVYAAWRAAAELGLSLGHSERSFELRQRALALQNRFDETYWCPELGTYAMALDGDGKPCRIRTSNAGQLLFTGIVPAYRVDPLVRTLMSDASFSGWGIRTLAAGEPRYNPMSYHRGSIWPHDTALIAAGFAEHGHHDELWKVFAGMLDASILMDLHRLPELFCGFQRRPDEGPSPYPVACAPQAWACGVVFLLLEASLRPVFDVEHNEVRFRNPRLPPFLEHVEIRNLALGSGTVDVQIRRVADGTIEGEVLARRGELRVVVEKSVEL